MAHRILVADDESASRTGLRALIARWGYEVEDAVNGQEALGKTLAFNPEVVIADLVMPDLDGLALLKSLQERPPAPKVIILTGFGTIETAVSAMKQGAYDYLTKPIVASQLKRKLVKALKGNEGGQETDVRGPGPEAVQRAGRLIGQCETMREVYRLIDRVAPTPGRVLILGESGTGKELVAKAIHERSARSNGPFVAINCSAIQETLLESEMFGHEKGAFTGAVKSRAGYFELAHGGTLFLDEVAEMNPAVQAKLLRVLEDVTLRHVGGETEIRVDVRVLAATNKEPLDQIKKGVLRKDLYYRLQVCTILLPPLRDRKEDVPLLSWAFIKEFNRMYGKHIEAIEDSTLKILQQHSWPGNIRELRNVIECAVMLCEGHMIGPTHLPSLDAMEHLVQNDHATQFAPGTTVEKMERELILRTLTHVKNNKTWAAEMLGISLKTLHNKLNRYWT